MNLTNLKIGKTQVVSSMKNIRKPEDAEPQDTVTTKFFETLLNLRLHVGYDVNEARGAIDLGDIGDLYFDLNSNDPSAFFSFNDKHFTSSFKIPFGAVAEVITSIIHMKKVIDNY